MVVVGGVLVAFEGLNRPLLVSPAVDGGTELGGAKGGRCRVGGEVEGLFVYERVADLEDFDGASGCEDGPEG